ncbi:hypothetical protein [Allochromatium vinosum]|uniref:hypothetical protein n=1 Tax=Allochromatium vinosum TaxID=1049 RepID=UPI001903E949|nr:hypothetical protein [Allochromatium vinosum]
MTILHIKKFYWRLIDRWGHWCFLFYLQRLKMLNVISQKHLTAPSGPVVSLTTYGFRAKNVYLTIESIGLGIVRPSRIILWLDDLSVLSNLPASLRRLQRRGLEIRNCENFGPHKKYYPYIEAEITFERPLVTADDDVIYPRDWLHQLLCAFEEDSSNIICYRAREILLSGKQLAPYIDWPYCRSTLPSFRFFATGVSGVIYPAPFQQYLKAAGRGFLDVCPKADDLWLHINALRSGYKIRQLTAEAQEFHTTPGTQEQALCQTNQFDSGNDLQILRTYSDADIAFLVRQE